MPRTARLVVPDAPHHITHRAIDNRLVFTHDDDRSLYLHILQEQSARWGLQVLAYCLMSDHVHLVAVPASASALAQAVGQIHWHYAQELNHMHNHPGYLWRNRFDSAPMDDHHLPLVVRYVEQNPVRAGLCRRPWEYAWSSAPARCGWGRPAITSPTSDARWRQALDVSDWSSQVAEALDPAELRLVRHATSRGRPIASEAWTIEREQQTGRSLRANRVGRPRSAAKA